MFYSWLIYVNFVFILSRSLFRKLKNSSREWPSLSKIEVNNPSFNGKWPDLAVRSQHFLRLFAVLSIHLFISSSLSICQSQAQLQKAFSLHAGALSLWHSPPLRGLWDGAGATKSWFLVLQLFCSCRTSLCVRPDSDTCGWASRIIHFSLSVFSAMSISLIRQEIISLAIRNHLFRHAIEGKLKSSDISPVVKQAKSVNSLQSAVHQIHSLMKSIALAVQGRLPKHLPNNRKYMRQETMTVTSIDTL